MDTKTQLSTDVSLNIEAITTFLQNSRLTEVIEGAKNKDVALFLGLTGSGKSTCISYLLGAKIESTEDPSGEILAKLSSDQTVELLHKKLPTISAGDHRSCTLYSELFDDENTGIAYCDTAGFIDTRYLGEFASLSTQLAVESANAIKAIVLVIDWTVFQRVVATEIEDLMSTLGHLLLPPYNDDSIIFLINKAPQGRNITHFKHLVSKYFEVFKEKMSQFSHRMSTTLTDTVEHQKLNRIALMLNVLRSHLEKKPENVIVMDVFDNGEKRECIRTLLRDKKDCIPKKQFNFKNYDEKRKRFDAELDKLATIGVDLINRYFTLQTKKKDLEAQEGHTKENQAYYAAFTNFIKANDEAVFSQMKRGLIELTKKEIERVGLEKESCSKKILELQQKNTDLLSEKIDLDKPDSTLIYQDSFNEPVAPSFSDWEWTKFAYFTKKSFIYPHKIPFLSYDCIGSGKFEICRENQSAGILEVIYTSCFGEDAQATFTVFSEKRRLPANHARLKQIDIEIPKNAERIALNQKKLERLIVEETELNELLGKTEAIMFDTEGRQREETERQFRKHFESNGLCHERSVIFLCYTFPELLEKNTLYLIKGIDNQITARLFGENPKTLSQVSSSKLCKIQGFPDFPKSTEKPVKISRVASPERFHKIAGLCGYAVMDIEKQKSQVKQEAMLLKEQLSQVNKEIDDKRSGFVLLENLSSLFVPSALIRPFLTLYRDYKKAIVEEAAMQRIQAENCLKMLDDFNMDYILKAENIEVLEKVQATLEQILEGLVDHPEAYQRASTLLCLCQAYQKKSLDQGLAIVDAFNQMLELIKQNTVAYRVMENILQKVVFNILCNSQMNEQLLIPMLDIFVRHFSVDVVDASGSTLLHLAITEGHVSAVQFLLKKNANVSLKNDQGESSIFVAAKMRRYSFIKLLLDQGRPNLQTQKDLLVDKLGNSIFSYLLDDLMVKPKDTWEEILKASQALSQYGAKLSIEVAQKSNSFFKLVLAMKIEDSALNLLAESLDETLLEFKFLTSFLSKLTKTEKQQFLLIRDNASTLLYRLLSQYDQASTLVKKILGFFIAKDAPMQVDILKTCIKMRRYEISEFLLERWRAPIDLNLPSADQKTWLGLAIESGCPQLVALFLKYKADPNQPSFYDLSEAVESRKGFTTIPPDRLRQYLYLPSHFKVGEAVDNGGCLFDAIAQIANSLVGALIHTEKSLRELCYRYYQKNPQEVEAWHRQGITNSTPVLSYDSVRYISQESPQGKVIYGRPIVEGVILCRMLDWKVIHVVEVAAHSENSTELTLSYYAITPKGYEPIRKIDIPDNVPLLAVSSDDLHFIPILPRFYASPLRLCVLKNNITDLHTIVQAKGNMLDKNALGQTLFHTAAVMGNLEMLKTLEAKMPVSHQSEWLLACDHEGDTPFNLTIQYHHNHCTEWMIEIGKKYTVSHSEKSTYWESVLHKENKQGNTALTVAIKSRNMGAVQSCFSSSHSFWSREEGDKALKLVLSDTAMPSRMLEEVQASKIAHCIELVKMHLQNSLRFDTFHVPFLNRWMIQLDKVLREEAYQSYRKTLMSTSMSSLQIMAEQLAIGVAHGIREKYHSEDHKTLLQKHIQEGTYHAWDYVLRTAIDKTLSKVSEQVQKSSTNHQISDKTDKHRAFTRALKDALRNYFYVSRALYEGRVLMNAEGLNAFKAACSIASPIITEIGSTLTSINIGVIGGFINATLELITRLRDAQYQCEAGRVVQAFGLCQPDAVEKYEKDIPIDHDQLKAVAEALYERYRDQIEQCTLSKESEISLRLAKTDGIYVLANIMADRIFQHIIKKESVKVEDDRTVLKQISDWFETVGSDNDIYKELSLISLPERCILAVLYECVGDDKDAHIRTEKWLRTHKTEDVWMAGGMLVKTGLKIASNPGELYVRKGNDAQESLHAKYGYCYLSDSMVHLKEIERRKFVKANQEQIDMFANQLSETDEKKVVQCFVM